MTTSTLFGSLAIVAFTSIWVFGTLALLFTRRLMGRTHVRSKLDVGELPAILRKVRKRTPMTEGELALAREVLADRGSVMALAIPAALFSLGCFFVFGSLEQLHGRTASERTFLGVLPMITSTNLALQMLRSARLKRRLPHLTAQRPADAPPEDR